MVWLGGGGGGSVRCLDFNVIPLRKVSWVVGGDIAIIAPGLGLLKISCRP